MVMRAMLLITMMLHGVRMKPVGTPCHGHGTAKATNPVDGTGPRYLFSIRSTQTFSFEDGGLW